MSGLLKKYNFFFFIWTTSFLYSQDDINKRSFRIIDSTEGFTRVYANGKFGFTNAGKIVIPIAYDYVSNFQDSLAMIEKSGKYGYMDKSGKVVIPIIYDYASDFRNGIAQVKKAEEYGYIYKNGKEVIIEREEFHPLPLHDFDESFVTSYVSDFREGFAAVKKNGKWGYIDKTGKEITPIVYDEVSGFLGAWQRLKNLESMVM